MWGDKEMQLLPSAASPVDVRRDKSHNELADKAMTAAVDRIRRERAGG